MECRSYGYDEYYVISQCEIECNRLDDLKPCHYDPRCTSDKVVEPTHKFLGKNITTKHIGNLGCGV